VGGADSILVPIVSLALGAQGLCDTCNVPGSIVGISERMRGGGSLNGGGGSGEGSNEVKDGLQTRRRKARRLLTKTRRQN